MSENQSKIQYVADGVNTVFQTPFVVFLQTGVEVYVGDNKMSANEYSVLLDEDKKATITFNAPPQNESLITIVRVLPVVRNTQFQEGGALRANTLNYEFDYQMACLQDVSENLNRAMAYPPYAVGGEVDLTLPTPEAGKSIVWSADGSSLENSNVLVNNLEATLEGYKNIALDASIDAINASELAVAKASEAVAAASNINGKANADMDNISEIGREKIANMVMPDYEATLTLSKSINAVQEMPSNGYVYIKAAGTNGSYSDVRIALCDALGNILQSDIITASTGYEGGISGTGAFVKEGAFIKVTTWHSRISNATLNFAPISM